MYMCYMGKAYTIISDVEVIRKIKLISFYPVGFRIRNFLLSALAKEKDLISLHTTLNQHHIYTRKT